MSVAIDRERMARMQEEVEEIRKDMKEINRKLDLLLERQDLFGMMRLSERSLAPFQNDEPDLYSVADLRLCTGER